ncbi:hypothetical protein RNAN_3202 [Rheinheimera nanhaiensis E407-8]|uniref:Uncharacterized protein n=1 Tax=Rheinheimera nanhaiensis E407-8 TaxID=562729 RepID=I1E1K5_9GAMM|nr:hypothetical protein RNAN_3202 [Rheinheimera nanhaiensis E407-8]
MRYNTEPAKQAQIHANITAMRYFCVFYIKLCRNRHFYN